MGTFFCYATVFQAVEVFAALHSERRRNAAMEAFSSMKLLGLAPKNAPLYGDLLARFPGKRSMDLLVAGLCLESGLPLLTNRCREFAAIPALVVVPTRFMKKGRRGEDILAEARRWRRGKR
jgi:predicted nucleic acid-binding protein